jgi:hypothetical protein
MDVQTLYGKGLQRLLCAGSRVARGKIAVSGVPNRLSCCLSLIVFIHRIPYHRTLEEFGGFKRGGQVIRTAGCTHDLVLLAKGETVLQGVSDDVIELEDNIQWKLMSKKLR